jgi:hypothetical protein
MSIPDRRARFRITSVCPDFRESLPSLPIMDDHKSRGGKAGVGLDAVRNSSRLEILLGHPGPALRRLAPLTAAMDRLEDADQKICSAR